jgi:hypothetical protein
VGKSRDARPSKYTPAYIHVWWVAAGRPKSQMGYKYRFSGVAWDISAEIAVNRLICTPGLTRAPTRPGYLSNLSAPRRCRALARWCCKFPTSLIQSETAIWLPADPPRVEDDSVALMTHSICARTASSIDSANLPAAPPGSTRPKHGTVSNLTRQ